MIRPMPSLAEVDDGLTAKQRSAKRWYQSHKVECFAYARRWYHKNRLAAREAARRRRLANLEGFKKRERGYWLRLNYGMTPMDYEMLLKSQRGRCYICQRVPGELRATAGKNLQVDHCHKTGYVRGLLCVSCNARVGWLEKHRGRIELYLSRRTHFKGKNK